MANRKRKISVRLREKDIADLRHVATYLKMDISECVRHTLRYGMAGLIKFETSGTKTLKKVLMPEQEDLQTSKKSISQEELEDYRYRCYLAGVPWLTPEENYPTYEEWKKEKGYD